MHRPLADTEQHNNALSTPRHSTERAQAGTEQGVHTTIMTASLGLVISQGPIISQVLTNSVLRKSILFINFQIMCFGALPACMSV